MEENRKQPANRIQTSLLNAAEKRVLVWIAQRLPKKMTSDDLTLIGFIGSVIIAIGYILSWLSVQWLWLASFGFFVNWFGDSLDGTVARVRGQQRPLYGYYLDHTMDMFNESLMFIGVGLSPFLHLSTAFMGLVLYLMLTVNVSNNAHLRGEFRLTYAKMGPTELRLVMLALNLVLIFVVPFREYRKDVSVFGHPEVFTLPDYIGIGIVCVLLVIFVITFFGDLRWYAKADPRPESKKKD